MWRGPPSLLIARFSFKGVVSDMAGTIKLEFPVWASKLPVLYHVDPHLGSQSCMYELGGATSLIVPKRTHISLTACAGFPITVMQAERIATLHCNTTWVTPYKRRHSHPETPI
jgi:hypothetical protein